jgi:hypothetical protein
MRKPPIPRAVPHRRRRERWAAVGACGVLVLGHAARAVVDAHHLAYLSVLDVLAVAAALGAGAQLLLVDDAISWYSAVGLASLVATASLVSLTVGFPGANSTGWAGVPLILLLASACVLVTAGLRWAEQRHMTRDEARAVRAAGVTRRARLRRPPPALRAERAPRGTGPVRRARRDPARPAA